MLVLEAATTIGGGMRSAELTLPGFVHDVCSAVHPLAVGSPFLRALPLRRARLECSTRACRWPTRSTTARRCVLERSLAATAAALGGATGAPTARSMEPLVRDAPTAAAAAARPAAPAAAPARARALRPAGAPLRDRPGPRGASRGERARALFAGCAAHSMLPPRAARHRRVRAGARRCSAHAGGWPIARGGSQRDRRRAGVAPALARRRDPHRQPGGVARRAAAGPGRAARPRLRGRCCGVAGHAAARRATGARSARYRYGPGRLQGRLGARRPGALDARRSARRAGTVHLGGTLDEIAASERGVARAGIRAAVRAGGAADPVRPRRGRRRASTSAWAYCHVPSGLASWT